MGNQIFDEYIELDIRGQLSNDQLAILEQDLEKWRNGLVTKLVDIDRQLTLRKGVSIQEGTKEARINYENWKRSAMGRKLAITNRIRDIKIQQKTLNVDSNSSIVTLLEDILEEIKEIKYFLKEYIK